MQAPLLFFCLLLSTHLPSVNAENFLEYQTNSVFLNETFASGFISNQNGSELFYIVFDSRSDPDLDSLIIWLSGGPGCSSELAIFMENGPFKINEDDLTLSINPFSWNNRANVLYVDQPAGTGFSSVSSYDASEGDIATHFQSFFLEFLEEHPQYKGRPIYITGESYAGHYIPVIASYLVHQANSDINIQGIAIGNGWVDPPNQYLSYPLFAYEYNLIDKEEFKSLSKSYEACYNASREGELVQAAIECSANYRNITGMPRRFNIYDITLPCLGDHCYDLSYVDRFLSKPEVQEALGVVGRPWQACNSDVHRELVIDHETRCAGYVTYLLEKGIPVLVYHGMLDFTCNYIGGEAWINALDYDGHYGFTNSLYIPFGEFGDYKNSQGLTFFKVYNAGHLVPMDQPEAAINMLYAFIDGFFDN